VASPTSVAAVAAVVFDTMVPVVWSITYEVEAFVAAVVTPPFFWP
jgi:hypothetical protein